MKTVVFAGVVAACLATIASAQQGGAILPQVHLRPPVSADEAKAAMARLAPADECPAPADAEPEFVVRDGAVYVRFGGTGVEVPFTGGGASGCWSRDLDRRARATRDYADVLKAVDPPADPAPK